MRHCNHLEAQGEPWSSQRNDSTCSLFKRLPRDLLGDKKGKENCYSLSCFLFPELFDILEKSQILSDPGPMLRAAWAVSPGGWMDVEAVTSEKLLMENKSRTLSFAC